MDQVRKLVTLSGTVPGAGEVVLGGPGPGRTRRRQQTRSGQPLTDPERLIVGELRVGGGSEHAGEKLVDAAASGQ